MSQARCGRRPRVRGGWLADGIEGLLKALLNFDDRLSGAMVAWPPRAASGLQDGTGGDGGAPKAKTTSTMVTRRRW